jgi:hypothetical protein
MLITLAFDATVFACTENDEVETYVLAMFAAPMRLAGASSLDINKT